MSDWFMLMGWPLAACIVLVGIHAYFGIHVLQRGIIFVDLSLAQVAALGTTVAFLFGFPLEGDVGYFFGVGFALIGGGIFAATRTAQHKIPQEAIIGIVYAVATAAAVLAVDRAPEGAEHIKYLLVGSVLTVTGQNVLKTAAVYAVVGLVHWIFRRQFSALTFGGGKKQLRCPRWWDFLFYATFGVVVTSSVKIVGVLMVFIILVVPASVATLTVQRLGARLAMGWIFGSLAALAGLMVSYSIDTPAGATVVCCYGALLALVAGAKKLAAEAPSARSR